MACSEMVGSSVRVDRVVERMSGKRLFRRGGLFGDGGEFGTWIRLLS